MSASVRMTHKAYVLDSYALIVFLEDGRGADRVSEIISVWQAPRYMSVINLAEVLSVIERRRSHQDALDLLEAVTTADEVVLVEPTLEQAVTAAEITAQSGLSLADSFAVALAQQVDGAVVTGDPEFKSAQDRVAVEWL